MALDIITILLISLGLAMDAFAVSIAAGFSLKKVNADNALKIALFFGAFQGVMPIMGWLLGLGFSGLVLGIGHYIAFILLAAIGIKMIYESTKLKEDKNNYLNNRILTLLAIATSIDALVVGATLSLIGTPIIEPAIVIGIVTFALCMIGVFLGKKIGHLFERKIEIIGGIILILIGL